MNLCSKDHEEICFEGRECPLCSEMADRKSKVEELESEISNLKDEVESLQSE